MKKILFSLGILSTLTYTACTKQAVTPQAPVSLKDAIAGQWQGVIRISDPNGMPDAVDISYLMWEFSNKDSIKVGEFSNLDTAYNNGSIITYKIDADTLTTTQVIPAATPSENPSTVELKYVVSIVGQEMVLSILKGGFVIEYKFKRPNKMITLLPKPTPPIVDGPRKEVSM